MKGFKEVLRLEFELKEKERIKNEKEKYLKKEKYKKDSFISFLKNNTNKKFEFFDFDKKERGVLGKKNVNYLIGEISKGVNIKINFSEKLMFYNHLEEKYFMINYTLRPKFFKYKHLSDNEVNASLEAMKAKGFKVGVINNIFTDHDIKYNTSLISECVKVAKLDSWGFYSIYHVFNLSFDNEYDFHEYVEEYVIPKNNAKENKRNININKFKLIK